MRRTLIIALLLIACCRVPNHPTNLGSALHDIAATLQGIAPANYTAALSRTQKRIASQLRDYTADHSLDNAARIFLGLAHTKVVPLMGEATSGLSDNKVYRADTDGMPQALFKLFPKQGDAFVRELWGTDTLQKLHLSHLFTPKLIGIGKFESDTGVSLFLVEALASGTPLIDTLIAFFKLP